jgi:hypothetical protein
MPHAPGSPPPDPVLHRDLLAELRALRLELLDIKALAADTRLQSQLVHLRLIRGHPLLRHGWLRLVIKDLETNPRTQYKVHLYGVVYWLANFPLVIALFFFEPALWLKLGVFITLMYSIYANFATDYGGMSAAMASFGSAPLPEIPVEAHVDAPGQPRTGKDSPGRRQPAMDRTFQGQDKTKGSFRGSTGVVIGRGGTGTDAGAPECPVCFALLGGDHGGLCPNAGLPPEDWMAEPPPGFEQPLREAPSQHGSRDGGG